MSTGDPITYSEDQEEAVADALAGSFEEESGDFATIRVRADIEWSGESRGVRTTNLTVGNASDLDRPMQRYREARSTPRASSYRAKGWQAQIRALSEAGERGSRAADRGGLDVTARTLTAWLSGDRAPSKANQQHISAAYEALAHGRRDAAVGKVAHEVASVLSDCLEAGEGVPIRLTDIESLEWS
jgi:hypothetical protein